MVHMTAEAADRTEMSQAPSAVSHDGFVEAVASHLRAKGHDVRNKSRYRHVADR